ncbi:MAG: glycosyltransferase family 39 protein [Pseudomonadota bacterium]|nr:glycosyltransferase family 39 protein [Pseudomonadota bacterium]
MSLTGLGRALPPLNPYLTAAMYPIIDVLTFDALMAAGVSLQLGHIAAFTLATALHCFLKVRVASRPFDRTPVVSQYLGLLLVALMAVFIRGAALGLLTQRWGWPAQVSILFTVALGMAVTIPGFSYVLRPGDSASRRRTLALSLIAYAFALRFVYLGSVELLPEEAYYWNYSRHLDVGYLDHPPMVAWLIWLGTAIFGQSEFGVRIGALCCGLITSFFAYRLTRNIFGETVALAALSLAQILPFFFLSGFLMTPDAPLTAAWAASLYFLERALFGEHSGAWWRAGLSLGLGFISKYSIALLGSAAFAFMMWDPQARRWWRSWQPYIAGLLALTVLSPVFIWNAQHEWASFAFQTSRRLAEAPRFALHKLLASTLVLITPTGVLAVAVGLTRCAGGDCLRSWRFLRFAILVPLTVFALFSLRHEVKLDWTGAPWTAALPVMAFGMLSGSGRIHAAWKPTLLVVLLLFAAGLHYLVLGLPGVGYGKHMELVPVGWRTFSQKILATAADFREQTGEEPLIVGMDRYAIASELAYYGAEGKQSALNTSSAHLFEGVGLMYQRWTPAQLQEGRTLLLVAWDPEDLAGRYVEAHAERFGPIMDGILTRDDSTIRHYSYRFAYHYLPVPR